MRSKQLVAFRPEVLEWLEVFLEENRGPLRGGPADEALRAVRQAKALYAGEVPGLKPWPGQSPSR